MRAFEAFPLRIAVIFHADADFEVKSAVDAYFRTVFLTLAGPKCFGKMHVKNGKKPGSKKQEGVP